MRSSKAWTPLFGLLLGACVPLDAQYLPLPEESVAASYVLRASDRELRAFEASEGVRATASGSSIVLLGYAAPLPELGLEPGSIVATSCRPCGVGKPEEIWAAPLSDGAPGAWQALDEIPDEILGTLIPDRSPRCDACIPYSLIAQIPIVDPELNTGAVAVGPDGGTSVVVVTANDGILRARSDQDPEALCAGSDPVPTAAWFDEDFIWLSAGLDGGLRRLARAGLDASSCESQSEVLVPFGERVEALAGSSTGSQAPFEIFALGTDSGRVARYRGATWEQHGSLEARGTGLAWEAPGVVLAVAGSPTVTRLRAGSQEVLPLIGQATLETNAVSVAVTEALGVVAGTSEHLLYAEDGDHRMQPLEEEQLVAAVTVGTILELDDRLLFTARKGGLGQYVFGHGYCEILSVFGTEAVRSAVVLDDGVIAFGGSHSVFFVDRPHECETTP